MASNGFAGQDAVGLPEPLTAGAVAKVLRGGDSVLAGLNERALTTMFAVSVNNDRLMRRFDPGLFDGNLALFVVTTDRGENPAGPAEWFSHVTGALHIHRIACRHDELTSPEALREICPQQVEDIIEGQITVPRSRRKPERDCPEVCEHDGGFPGDGSQSNRRKSKP
ncbi:hypothetical protein [Salinispora mooreana]|uniref:hypothetical protein n=1 Tax=Salinispora mooreana TaxID=999545 RepID=UPI00035CD8FA|nr:hypothetical protein [Salinispora mooreana]